MSTPEGYRRRPLETADAEAVAALINEFERAYLEEPDTVDGAEVSGWWVRFDLPTDSLAFVAPDGSLAACATAHERTPGTLGLDAYVAPAHQDRGIGSALLDWLEQEARHRDCSAARTGVLSADRAAQTLITARGYEPVRHFYRMLIELDAPPPEPVWPEGFALSTFRPGDEDAIHAVTEDAFSEHWGHEPRSLEHWATNTFAQAWWDPSLVYLVREGNEVVAGEIAAVRFGLGWVGTIGTRKPWRGRGLGRALLLEAFGEFYRRGELRIGLAVDAANETGATHLYESAGMHVASQSDVYEKHL